MKKNESNILEGKSLVEIENIISHIKNLQLELSQLTTYQERKVQG